MGFHHGHRPCPALRSCSGLSRHSGHRQDDCNYRFFAISDHKKIVGLYNINEWWKWHRSHMRGSFCMQICMPRDLFTDLPAGEATVWASLSQWLTGASQIRNRTYRKKLHTKTSSQTCPMWTRSDHSTFPQQLIPTTWYHVVSPSWSGRQFKTVLQYSLLVRCLKPRSHLSISCVPLGFVIVSMIDSSIMIPLLAKSFLIASPPKEQAPVPAAKMAARSQPKFCQEGT